MTAKERGKALAGDMPWVTEHLTLEEQADLPKQLAAAIQEAEQAMKERCIAVMKETCAADCNDGIFPRSLEEAERLMRALE